MIPITTVKMAQSATIVSVSIGNTPPIFQKALPDK